MASSRPSLSRLYVDGAARRRVANSLAAAEQARRVAEAVAKGAKVLVGGTRKTPADAEEFAAHINRIAALASFASGNFNNGLRAYYFGVAALSWFLHPVLMMIMTVSVIYVLHEREFRSRTLQILCAD